MNIDVNIAICLIIQKNKDHFSYKSLNINLLLTDKVIGGVYMSKERDSVKLFITFMNALAWSSIFFAMIFLDKARPETKSYHDIYYNKLPRTTWELSYVTISLWFFIIATSISLLGLLINLGFIGDKKHRLSIGLVLNLLISLCFSFAYIFFVL